MAVSIGKYIPIFYDMRTLWEGQYNGRAAGLAHARKQLIEHQAIAQNASTPEERERYRDSAERLENYMIPLLERQARELAARIDMDQASREKINKFLNDRSYLSSGTSTAIDSIWNNGRLSAKV